MKTLDDGNMISKEEFWDALTQPTDRGCFNCAHDRCYGRMALEIIITTEHYHPTEPICENNMEAVKSLNGNLWKWNGE